MTATAIAIDEVEFHPAWHELMRVAVTSGLHAAPWRDDRPGAHVARAAAFYVWGQTDAGHGCPISMTYSIVPALGTRPTWPAGSSRCWPRGTTTPACARRSRRTACCRACR